MKKLPSVMVACVVLLGFSNMVRGEMIAHAITGVTANAGAYADHPNPGNGSPLAAADGRGLALAASGSFAGQYVHDEAWENDWQAGAQYMTDGSNRNWFLMDLGSTYSNLDEAWVWNARSGGSIRGSKNVDVYFSTSPADIPGTNTGFDFSTAEGWTHLTNLDISQAVGNNTPVDTKIDLSSINSARYLALVINSNWGSNTSTGPASGRMGLAEVQITATAVPEPTSMISLSALGVICLLAFARRNRR